jgi:hypothetical protein
MKTVLGNGCILYSHLWLNNCDIVPVKMVANSAKIVDNVTYISWF